MFPIIHVCLLRKKIVGDYAGMFRKQMRTVFEAFLWRGQTIERGRFHIKIASYEKKYFFVRVKNFPQEIENTREII